MKICWEGTKLISVCDTCENGELLGKSMGKKPTDSGVEDTRLVHIHGDVPTCPHAPAFCVTDSYRSASCSGWGMSLSDLNSPKGRILCTPNQPDGFWIFTWDLSQQPGNLWSLTAPADGQTEGRGNLYCLQTNRRLSSLLMPSQRFSSASNQSEKCLKRKKAALWSRLLLCIIPEHNGAPSSKEGLLGTDSV